MKITVLTKPNAKQEKLEKVTDDVFRAWVKDDPKQGRANTAVLRLLSRHFSLPETAFSILSGHQSRHKIIGFEPS